MIYTITLVPYRVAFIEVDSTFWQNVDLLIDCLFMADVIINCFSAYFVTEDELEVSKKKIFLNYLMSWMVLDIIASIPFQFIFTDSNWKGFIKLGKLPRFYRLIKIVKLLRVIKSQSNFQSFSNRFFISMGIPLGLKRLLYFLVAFGLICHLIACLWYFTSTLQPNAPYNWVTKYGIQDQDNNSLYISSLYWTVTTLSTVGYGDITPANSLERGVCILVMLGGVFFYSYTVGTITSLMTELDKKKVKFENKVLILNDINKNYSMGKKLYRQIKAALEFDKSNFNKDKEEMIASLPKKLAFQLNLIMNKQLVEKNNKFFENRPIPFINLILNSLRPLRLKSKDHVFYKGEYATEMYFITLGEVSVYDTYNNSEISCENLSEGNYCGDIGVIIGDVHEFGVKAIKDCDLMALTRDDLFTKVLSIFDEQLKTDLISRTIERRDSLRTKRDEVVSKHIRNKKLVESIDTKKSNDNNALAPGSAFDLDKNAKKIRKIRNTLSPKTLSMLEFTGVNDLEKIKREIEALKFGLRVFKKKLREDSILK
jgi:CRP-like cAMP-binding protein